jgi:hypothetical protein
MNITTEQAKEILELLSYVADEVWGKTRKELELRTAKIEHVIKEGLEDEK